jgi:hypothetical protein
MVCPHSEKVAPYLDEQLSVAEAKRFEAHLDACSYCNAQLEQTRSLISTIRADSPDSLGEAAFIDGVMDAIKTPPAVSPTPFRLALAAGIGILVLIPFISLEVLDTPEEMGFSARGAAEKRLGSLVDAAAIVVNGETIRPLDEKTVLGAGDGLTFQYTNRFDAPVYFMAFAVDAQRAVHWFYPAYLTEASDPSAIPLSKDRRDQLMPDIVQAEDVPEGSMKVIILLSRKKRTVKQVEKMLRDAPVRPVNGLFSGDDIVKTWTVKYQK